MNLMMGVVTPPSYSGSCGSIRIPMEFLTPCIYSMHFRFQFGFILVQTGHHHSMSLEKGVDRCHVSLGAFILHLSS